MSIGCVVVPSMSRSSGSYVEKESYISCHSRGRWALDKLSRESRLLVDSFVWNVVSSLWEEVRGSGVELVHFSYAYQVVNSVHPHYD